MNTNTVLCRDFASRAKEFLSHHPHIQHSWSIDADETHCILDMPQSPEGFDITIEVFSDQIIVFGKGFHEHFEPDENTASTIENSLELMLKLLGSNCRIREFLSNNQPYRWHAEIYRENHWIRFSSTALFFWNYFGKRSQRIYQNHLI